MERAHAAGVVPTAEQQLQHEARSEAAADGRPRNLTIAGNVAEIRVEGALTKKPDFFSWLFGGGNTTYQQIQQALVVAESDPAVTEAVMRIDSPGGHVDGFFACLDSIKAFKKPLRVVAETACSAAYAIAAVAGGKRDGTGSKKGGGVEATNAAAEFGSIGVAARFFVSDSIVNVTSTEAPNKRPDVRTEEGKDVVRKNLDDVHALFVDAIAAGRGTSAAKVNKNYGRGAVVLAGEAQELGMVDRIARPALRPVEVSDGPSEEEDPIDATRAKPQESVNMTEDEFKKAHPELHKTMIANAVAGERDRVVAHLIAGEMSGDMKTAATCIRDGSAMTMTLQTQYMMAATNRSERYARQGDSDAAGSVVDGGKPQTPGSPAPAAAAAVPQAAAETVDMGDAIVAELDKGRKPKKVA
jgi:ClpP class serine protease